MRVLSKITILCGIPGSGKSTWAQQQGKPIVSRDILRKFYGAESKATLSWQTENEITDLQNSLVAAYIEAGLDVIVDDMNVRSRYITQWIKTADSLGADVEMRKFALSVDEAVARNRSREDAVPEDALLTIARKYTKNGDPTVDFEDCLQLARKDASLPKHALYVPDVNKPKAIIVDLDGTLAHNTSGRGWFDLGYAVYADEVDDAVQMLAQSFYAKGYELIFVTGRDERVRPATEKWLKEKAGFFDYTLLMRPAKDNRKDSEIKLELFDEHIRNEYNVRICVDDRRQVTQAWRSIGLTVWQVAEGDF